MITLTRKQFRRITRRQINRWLRDGYTIQVVRR
jgi:hypothetical protein